MAHEQHIPRRRWITAGVAIVALAAVLVGLAVYFAASKSQAFALLRIADAQRDARRLRATATEHIRNESRTLLAKGVARDVASQAVAGLDESDAAYRAGEKFARRLRDLDFRKFSARLWAHLRRRGFNATVSRDIVSRLWSESSRQNDFPVDSSSTYLFANPEDSEGFGNA